MALPVNQIRSVLRQQVPPRPRSDEFISRLETAVEPPSGPAPDAALYGETFSKVRCEAGGQKKTQQCILGPLKDFQKVLAVKQCTLDDLDDFLTAFAKWCLRVEFLIDTKKEQEDALAQRKELCANAGVKVRSWLPNSMRTSLNGAAAAYKKAGGTGGVVLSEPTLFPKYCDFFAYAYRNSGTGRRKDRRWPFWMMWRWRLYTTRQTGSRHLMPRGQICLFFVLRWANGLTLLRISVWEIFTANAQRTTAWRLL